MVKTRPPEFPDTSTSAPTDASDCLDRILREAWDFTRDGRSFLAVFDLDSTLFDLTLRISAILDDFRTDAKNQERFPDECRRLRDVKILSHDWGLGTPLERAGLKTDTAFFIALHQHWARGFFSNDYLFRDEPLPGSVDYVRELHQIGAHIMYLTGRDIPRMANGTVESLRVHGFPVDVENVRLVLKPNAQLIDEEFKLEVLKREEETYDRIWLFENEPVNLNLIAERCPEIGLVFIESTHSGREELAPVLDRIRHFEADLNEFRAHRLKS